MMQLIILHMMLFCTCPVCLFLSTLPYIIIHQTQSEKSDWSRAFNQFTIACELDMINVLSAADITLATFRLEYEDDYEYEF